MKSQRQRLESMADDDIAEPEDFWRMRRGSCPNPELVLWAAVIERAKLDSDGKFGKKVQFVDRPQIQAEARAWLAVIGLGP